MNKVSASFCLYTVAGLFARRDFRLAKRDFAAIGLDGLDLHSGRVFGHDDVGWDAAPGRSAGHGCAVIAARLRDDSACSLLIRKRQDGVGRSANLERTGFLEGLALEEEACSGHGIERGGSQDGRAANPRRNAGVCGANRLPRRRLIISSFKRSGCAHGRHVSAILLLAKEALWHVWPGRKTLAAVRQKVL